MSRRTRARARFVNWNSFWNQGSITNAYSTGTATGTSGVGGFLGAEVTGGTLGSDYWDTLASGNSTGVGSGSSTGLTAVGGAGQPSPYLQASYAGFDFTNTWVIISGNRPSLKNVP